MSVSADVSEVDAFRVGLGRAADELADLDQVNAAGAASVLGVVDPPRRTGRLASTVEAYADALGVTLTAGGPEAPYGPIVHARDPFLSRALARKENELADRYTDHAEQALNLIQGA